MFWLIGGTNVKKLLGLLFVRKVTEITRILCIKSKFLKFMFSLIFTLSNNNYMLK